MERRSSPTIRTGGAFRRSSRGTFPRENCGILSGLILCKSRAEASVRRLHRGARRVASPPDANSWAKRNVTTIFSALALPLSSSKRAAAPPPVSRTRSRYLLSRKSDAARDKSAGHGAKSRGFCRNAPGIALRRIFRQIKRK